MPRPARRPAGVLLALLAVTPLPAAHDPPACLAALDASIAARPNDPALYFERGMLLLHVQAAAKALADFDRAGTLRADFPHLDLGRGLALRALGRHDEAATAAVRALARDPQCGAAAALHARSLAASDRLDPALRAWDVALALAPRSVEFHLERADVAVRRRTVDDAIAGLDRAMRELGELVTLQERAVGLCEQSGRYDEAARRLDRLLAGVARPESWLAWQARLLDRAGRPAAAAAARAAALAAIDTLPAVRRDVPAVRSLAAGLARALQHAPLVPPATTGTRAAPSPAPVSPPVPVSPAGAGAVLLPRGTWWRYSDRGVDLGTNWRSPAYADSRWPTGYAQLGFGDGDENWVVYGGPAGNRTPTIYFRRAFDVPDPTVFALAHLELLRDDGAVVYLNGVEIARSNMPVGPVAFGTLASVALGIADERVYVPIAFSPSLLVRGSNVLAVEVHQAAATSSDLSFDLELVATPRLSVARGPYLQLVTPTTATVRWRTDAPCPTGLWLGPSPTALALVHTSAQRRTEHEVALSGLLPATRYYYAVGDGVQQLAGATADFFFTTSPAATALGPTRIWVLGDSGTGDANALAVRNGYLAFAGTRRADLMLMLGDNAYSLGTDADYQRGVFDMYPSILRNTPLWPALGNHDAIAARTATGTGPYYDIFTLPTRAEAGGLASGTEAYYAFDRGSTHFVCLDSQDSDRSPTGAMLQWLDADLRNTTAEWVIAFFHHPPYSKGSHDSDSLTDSEGRLTQMRKNALPVLERHGVDLVLTGHSHSYERSYLLYGHYGVSATLTRDMLLDRGDGRESGDGAYVKARPGLAPKQGAVHVVAGSAGSLGGGRLDHPAHCVSLNQLGSLVLDIDGRRLDASFVDTTGAVRDRFTVQKGVQRWLVRDEPAISTATGGTQVLSLTAGAAHGNSAYVVAGSLGTSPGFMHSGQHVPLNPDNWFATTLRLANSSILQNTAGQLDASGTAQARIVLPRLPASLAGVELYHAFVVFSGGRVVGASNAVKLRLVP